MSERPLVTQRVGHCEVTAEFGIGDVVYLKLARERLPGFVTAIQIDMAAVRYRASWGDYSDTWHFGFELSRDYVPDYASG